MRKEIYDMNLEELEATMNEYLDAIEIAYANLDRARMELEQAKDEWVSTKRLIEKRMAVIKAGLEAEITALRSKE